MTEQDDQDCANFQNMINSYLSTRDSKSPPKAQVDEASLQKAMDKNKESLKVKLMMRRPINQLVEQGIMPSPKKPLQYLQQCQKLERAQTENILKNLMKTRPDRQALIDHHILEDTTIDPSLQDKQRQLKKARLADDLNDRLSHRPGPLELVKGNILHTDEKFAQAVKEGQIPFKRTCEGQVLRHPMPCFTFEDDSGSDAALSPPQDILDQSLGSMPSVESMVLSPYPNQDSPSSSMGELRIASSTPPSSQPSPSPTFNQAGSITSLSDAPQKESNTSTTRRKKSKPKAPPKTRTIKFHEYKGPPSAQKNQASQSPEETSYELLLQQQQLFLQWQLEMQQKYPQVILPVPQQPSGDQSKSTNSVQNSAIEKSQETMNASSPSLVKNFEDLKVNGLKAECKKRNLPVSGSKVQLLERLRNHIESSNNNKITPEKNNCTIETTTVPITVSGIILDSLPTLVTQQAPVTSVVTVDAPITNRASQITLGDATEALMVYNTVPVQGQIMSSRPSSTAPMDVEMSSNADAMDCTENPNTINEEIVKRQQQKIFQLERELERSQRQLQQQQWWQRQQQQAQQQVQQQVLLASHPVPIAPAPPSNHVSMATALPQPTVAQAVVQQQLLQHKSTPQQLLQQASKYPPGSAEQQTALVKASLAAFIHNQQASNSIRLRNGLATPNQQNISQFTNLKPIVLCQAQTVPAVIEKPRANSLPNGIGQQKMVWSSSVPNFSNVIAPKITVGTIEPKFLLQKAPPDYNEVVKPQVKVKQEKPSGSKRSGRKSVKSQEVDDVLDVLISHGELPPSAAQEPPTPTTPETQKGGQAPPAFPGVVDIKPTLSVSNPSVVTTPEESVDSSLKMNSSSNSHDERNDTNTPLVFDLNLDLQDLETMDLGVLDRNDISDPTPHSSSCKSDSLQQQQQTQNNCTPSYSDLDMDVELSDWLDILTNNNSVTNANQSRICSFNSDNGDPLLPSMENGQETLDMFALDNLDFKLPSDSNLLSWDKIDYAT